MGTFLAILLGTIGGGVLISLPGGQWWLAAVTLALAGMGILTAYRVPKTKAACPELMISVNPIPSLIESMKLLRETKAVFNSVLGISWLWFFGAAVLSTLPTYCKDFLGAGEQVVTCFLATFTIGTAIGSFLCEKLSFKRVEIGLVPIGSLGMTIFLVDLFFARPEWLVDKTHLLTMSEFVAQPGSTRLLFDFFMMSLFGGLFVLPLYTLIQERSHPESRSRVIAGNNIVNALFMVVSSVVVMLFHAMNFSYPQIFLALGIMNLAVAFYIYSIVPEFTLRFIAWIIARTLYRIRSVGEDNIPKQGPVVLVCNHVSFADWLVILALVRRPVRFVMYYKFFEIPLLRYLMKQAKVIPIAGAKEDPKIMEEAFNQVARELEDGEIICIFPEGKVTRDGEMAVFRPGIEKILQRNAVPVVPMALKGLWGSFFGYGGGKAFRKAPRRWLSPVELTISEPIPADKANAQMLHDKVKTLVDSN
jgi:1-acyl-sn-glycerol-3-phosphate acyltransferase